MDSDIASGGSGSAASDSRASATNILFAVSLLVVSLVLIGVSRRVYRLKTSIGLGLCLACAGWAVTVSRLGTSSIPDLAIWGIVAGCFTLGAALGALWLWMVGLAGMAVASGFAFALSILLMCPDGGINSAGGRWGLVAAFGILALVAIAFVPANWRKWLEVRAQIYYCWDCSSLTNFRSLLHSSARTKHLCRRLAALRLHRHFRKWRCRSISWPSTHPRHKFPSLAIPYVQLAKARYSASHGSKLASDACPGLCAMEAMAGRAESARFAN